jgi:DNA-directed RNA polymerase
MEKVLKEKYVKLHAEAIIMKIEEIYDQTPKKGTGNLVEPLNQAV